MNKFRAFLLRLNALFGNSAQDRDLSEELESNIQLHTDENVRQGMSLERARRQAILKLGGVEPTKESVRDRATLPVLENLLRDIRFAIRQLRKDAGFTCTAVFMLALGMCASVAIFAFVDAALLKPLPYKDSKRLVGVFEKVESSCPFCNLSYPDFLDWKRMNTVFGSFDAYNHQSLILTTSSGVQRAFATRVTAGFFHTLGVTPILGRDFRPGEDLLQAPRTLVLSYSAWRSHYGGSSKVLGKTVILDGNPNVIIGVLPREFHFAPAEPADYWTTMHASSECDLRRSCHGLFGVARLKKGVSFQTALKDVTAIAAQLEKQYPGDNRGQGAALQPLPELISGNIRPILLVMLGGACLLLVISAVNVASLLLLRTKNRRRELAVRSGLGASRARLISQFIVEGLVLVALGTALGLVAAYGTMRILTGLISADMLLGMPYLKDLGLNFRVLLFAGLISVLTAVLFSVTPALCLSVSQMREDLAEGSRGSSGSAWRRMGSPLVVVELATAVVLLCGAGLLAQSLYRILTVKIGLQPDRLVLMYMGAPGARYVSDEQKISLERQITSSIAAIPGVTSVGVSSDVPIGFNGDTTWFKIMGRPWHGEHNDTPERDVTPGYFKTLGARLIRGRYFEESEDLSKPRVAIVNQAFAHHYFPGENSLGQRISPLADPPVPIEIVGIIEDIKEGPLDVETPPVLYFPFHQSAGNSFGVLARTTQSDVAVIPAMTAAIRRVDPGIITTAGQTMAERIDDSQSAYLHRSLAWLVGGFAALALLMSMVGLYGVVAYSVGQRTREIGIRIALGAERATIYTMILNEAGWLILSGTAMGLICSIPATLLMKGLLFEVHSGDPYTLATVAVILATAALAASLIPARRAASINPVEALRAQ